MSNPLCNPNLHPSTSFSAFCHHRQSRRASLPPVGAGVCDFGCACFRQPASPSRLVSHSSRARALISSPRHPLAMAQNSWAAQLDRLVTNPAYHDVLAILKGARNGLVYGVRVRAPHALIMTLIFHSHKR